MKKLKVVCYGEVLWDVFGKEKKIGGAPLNVALRLNALGADAIMVSCVGKDEDGAAILSYLEQHQLKTVGICENEEFPTGLVTVTLNERGSASYEINYPSAWDKIILNDTLIKEVASADALIFGSLICRDEVSRNALDVLLQTDIYKVFDVNLRKPHYKQETLQKLMAAANFVKFNDEELLEIASAMGSKYQALEDNIEFIAKELNIEAMCVTKGKHGSILLWKGNLYYNEGYPIVVADTVGAGDSYLAALINGLMTGNDPQEALNLASAIGALVAQASGANPEVTPSQIEKIMNKKVS